MTRTSAFARRTLLTAGGLLVAAPAVLLGSAVSAAVPAPDTTALVTLATGNTTGVNNTATLTDVSADGRFVVYESTATDALSGVTNPNGHTQVYRRDLSNGSVDLVSARTDGTPASDGSSFDAVISADGRFVAFTSGASSLAPGILAAPANVQVYIRDFGSAPPATEILSGGGGVVGDGPSGHASISDNGQRIAFDSTANNLTNSANKQILVRALGSPPAVVSVKDGTVDPANGESQRPSISGDGAVVAFSSLATDLLSTDKSETVSQVYARDLDASTTELISADVTNTTGGELGSDSPSVNLDGTFIAYQSQSTDLTPEPSSATDIQVFVRNVGASKNELISVSLAGIWANKDSSQPSISSDGNRVAFQSAASDVASGVTRPENTVQVYARERSTATTLLVSATAANRLNGGGPENKDAWRPSITQDGKLVGFSSAHTDLTSVASFDFPQGYLRALPLIFPTPTDPGGQGGNDGSPGAGGTTGKGGLASTGADILPVALLCGTAAAVVATGAFLLARRRRA